MSIIHSMEGIMSPAQARAGWRKSSQSAQGNGCVEVDFTLDGVEIRDTKIDDSPVFVFTAEQWGRWLAEVSSGVLTNTNGAVVVSVVDDCHVVRAAATRSTLTFDTNEWNAFTAGVRDGEFEPSAALAGAGLA
jgi:hypothetical protein